MNCREFLRRYSEYDDSLIPAFEADRFRAHMAECPSCARYDRVLRKGRMLARQLPRLEPDPDFLPRLRLRLLQQPRRRPIRARLAAGLAAATVLI
ncbi:MAG: zf-HC2 domain-containing protein, partial [Gemmatimonadota bacterium]